MADKGNVRVYDRPHPVVMNLPVIAIVLTLIVLTIVVVLIRYF